MKATSYVCSTESTPNSICHLCPYQSNPGSHWFMFCIVHLEICSTDSSFICSTDAWLGHGIGTAKNEEFICSTYSSFICSTDVWIRHLIGRGVTRRQNQYEFATCLSCVLLNHCRLHTSRPEETFQGGALFARDSDWDGEIRQIRSHAATQWGEGAGVISYNSASSLIMNHPFTHMLALTNLCREDSLNIRSWLHWDSIPRNGNLGS